ncbi:MAG: transporter substrate-binding domain-containing protein [Prevotellaceae bacterium]|jgi:membrane-bound lytic murein transglycosylase F|nr:transporter substrate-binding domain-containing protein [Prevotellaceae bacterium]
MKKDITILLILIVAFFVACSPSKKKNKVRDMPQIQQSDTLVVGSIYGSSSYFVFKGEEMGFDYELIRRFADDHGLKLKVVLVNSVPELITLLEKHAIDVVASRLAITNERKQQFLFTNNEYINMQVLVQRSSRNEVNDVVQLIGKEIFVNEKTKYEERLRNLNAELGGGITITTVPDSLTVDNLIEMVSLGQIDYTVAENDIAMLNKTYFRNLDCKLPLSFNQRSAWAVSKEAPQLQQAINTWFDSKIKRAYYNSLYNKYFVQAKYFGDCNIKIPKNALSPYDELFRRYAERIDWDWYLLAAVAFEESRFDTYAESWVGARGLMQLMPRTYTSLGLNDSTVVIPEPNIEAATRYINMLNNYFADIADKNERIKFILASYNAGHSHIFDAMALAKKYGKNPDVWFGNVEEYLLLKSHREYYTDPVVRSGYFRGTQTSRYVVDVLRTYEKFKERKTIN